MNPVFLKHREKIEYSDYDGSDLVYPGDKKPSQDKKNTDAEKNKKPVQKPAVQSPNKGGAKPTADAKQSEKGNGNGVGQATGKGTRADDKSAQNKGGADHRVSIVQVKSEPINNSGVGASGDKSKDLSLKKDPDLTNEVKNGEHSVKKSLTAETSVDFHGENNSMLAHTMGSATQRTSPRKYVSPIKRLKSLEKSGPLKTVDFELAGKVFGNEFRSQITELANETGVTGYVGRTNIGTIAGVLQGPSSAVDEMKQWIKAGGTDKVKIDRCAFTHEKSIDKMSLLVFIKFVEIIKRDPENNILTQPYHEQSNNKSPVKGSPKKDSLDLKNSSPPTKKK